MFFRLCFCLRESFITRYAELYLLTEDEIVFLYGFKVGENLGCLFLFNLPFLSLLLRILLFDSFAVTEMKLFAYPALVGFHHAVFSGVCREHMLR